MHYCGTVSCEASYTARYYKTPLPARGSEFYIGELVSLGQRGRLHLLCLGLCLLSQQVLPRLPGVPILPIPLPLDPPAQPCSLETCLLVQKVSCSAWIWFTVFTTSSSNRSVLQLQIQVIRQAGHAFAVQVASTVVASTFLVCPSTPDCLWRTCLGATRELPRKAGGDNLAVHVSKAGPPGMFGVTRIVDMIHVSDELDGVIAPGSRLCGKIRVAGRTKIGVGSRVLVEGNAVSPRKTRCHSLPRKGTTFRPARRGKDLAGGAPPSRRLCMPNTGRGARSMKALLAGICCWSGSDQVPAWGTRPPWVCGLYVPTVWDYAMTRTFRSDRDIPKLFFVVAVSRKGH